VEATDPCPPRDLRGVEKNRLFVNRRDRGIFEELTTSHFSVNDGIPVHLTIGKLEGGEREIPTAIFPAVITVFAIFSDHHDGTDSSGGTLSHLLELIGSVFTGSSGTGEGTSALERTGFAFSDSSGGGTGTVGLRVGTDNSKASSVEKDE
jgi:hypothetical protein